MAAPTVARINVTPLKSAALVHPASVRVERWGVVGNRALYLVTPEGRLWNGSKHGPICRVRADLDGERLALTLPDGAVVAGTLEPGDAVATDFYGREVRGRFVRGPWAAALAPFAGGPVELALPDEPGAANDVEPITLVSLASVADLGWRGGSDALDPTRFRMTFELDGCSPYEEDTWDGREVRVGGVRLAVHGQVPRCVVTTLDPATGVRDFPTLSVIKRERRIADGAKLPFGMYARVLEPGEVRVGDPVEVA